MIKEFHTPTFFVTLIITTLVLTLIFNAYSIKKYGVGIFKNEF